LRWQVSIFSGVSLAVLLLFFTISLFQNPYSKTSTPTAPKVPSVSPSVAHVALFTAASNSNGY